MPPTPDHELSAERSWVFLSVLPATLLTFLFGPILHLLAYEWVDLVLRMVFDGSVFLAMWAYSPSRTVTRVGFALLLGALLGSLAVPLGILEPASAIVFGASCEGLLASASLLIQLRYLVRARRVTAAHLSSAVFAYLLIGVVWTFLYLLVWIGADDSFDGIPARAEFLVGDGSVGVGRLELRGQVTEQLSYFSFVTLTTLGYGDVSPVGHVARSLATLEALIGQVYLTVLVAHLVSLNIARRTTEA